MRLNKPLDELDPIAERVTDLEALIAGERHGVQDMGAPMLQCRSPVRQIGHLIGQMRLRGPAIYPLFRPHMYLDIPH